MTLSSSLITLYAFKCVLYLALAYLSFAAAKFLKREMLNRKLDQERLDHADKLVMQLSKDNARLRQALYDICKVYSDESKLEDPTWKLKVMYGHAYAAFSKRQ